MKVISPSARIMSELELMTIAQRIERCGRICYKSEDKITAESSVKFVDDVIKRGHNSVLEMAVLTIDVMAPASMINDFYMLLPKYLMVDWLMPEHLLITGSVRAFRELAQFIPHSMLVAGISQYMHGVYPDLFADPCLNGRSMVTVRAVSPGELVMMSDGLILRHRHVAVKFVVNRAVSHEIVRHRPCSFLQESQRYCRYSADKFGGEVTFIKPLFWSEDTMEYAEWYRACNRAEYIYLSLLGGGSSPQAARTVLPNSCKTEIIVFANLIEWQHILTLRTSSACDPSMREVMTPLVSDFRAMWPSYFDFIVEQAA